MTENPGDWVVVRGVPSPELLARYERVRSGLGQQAMEMFRSERELIRRRMTLEHSRTPRAVPAWETAGAVLVNLVVLVCGTGLVLAHFGAGGYAVLACWSLATVARNAAYLWRAAPGDVGAPGPAVCMSFGAACPPEVIAMPRSSATRPNP